MDTQKTNSMEKSWKSKDLVIGQRFRNILLEDFDRKQEDIASYVEDNWKLPQDNLLKVTDKFCD